MMSDQIEELEIEYYDDGTQKTDTDAAQVNYLQNFLENDGTFMFKYKGFTRDCYLRIAKLFEAHYEMTRCSLESNGNVTLNELIVTFTEVDVFMLKAMQGLSQQMNIMTTWELW